MDRNEEGRGGEVTLIHDKLRGVHGYRAPRGGLVVAVVHLVDISIQPGVVEQSVEIVRHSLIVNKERH